MSTPVRPVTLTRRHFMATFACAAGALTSPSSRAGTPRRIVTADWAAAESLLAIGLVPLAVADAEVYRQWLPGITLPEDVLDLGSRAEPNLELIAWLHPDEILISNWQASLAGQFERIAPTQKVTIIDPPSSPLENARRALRQISRFDSREDEAEHYLAAFDDTLSASAASLKDEQSKDVIVGVLHENGRQIYAYGKGSWVHEIIGHLGLRNALGVQTSRFGNALIDLAQLAQTPAAHLLYLDQGDRTRRAEFALARSTLWQTLPMVKQGRVKAIPVFYPLGGIPSAMRCARVLATAVTASEA